MHPGDLILYGTKPHWELPGVLGILLRKLQYDTDDDLGASNWDGNTAWWVQFVQDDEPLWAYEDELTLVRKGN